MVFLHGKLTSVAYCDVNDKVEKASFQDMGFFVKGFKYDLPEIFLLADSRTCQALPASIKIIPFIGLDIPRLSKY
jgi:hypothetical protein